MLRNETTAMLDSSNLSFFSISLAFQINASRVYDRFIKLTGYLIKNYFINLKKIKCLCNQFNCLLITYGVKSVPNLKCY